MRKKLFLQELALLTSIALEQHLSRLVRNLLWLAAPSPFLFSQQHSEREKKMSRKVRGGRFPHLSGVFWLRTLPSLWKSPVSVSEDWCRYTPCSTHLPSRNKAVRSKLKIKIFQYFSDKRTHVSSTTDTFQNQAGSPRQLSPFAFPSPEDTYGVLHTFEKQNVC